MTTQEIKNKLKEAALKITPQRIAILEAIYKLDNHPTAEKIIEYTKESHPSIAIGTVYKVLETLVNNKIVKKVKTENNIMHYDGINESHHHLYCSKTEQIEDYVDNELDKLLESYFTKKGIVNFEIEEIKLQINGKFLNNKRRKNERKKY